MIKVENLTRRFGRTVAVNDISFEVKPGEIVGFLGPNGAGKTTTMQVLTGYLPATAGTVTVAGFDVFTDSIEVRRRTGYLPESVPLYNDMRVNEYLRFRGRLKGMHGRRLRQRVRDVLGMCGLSDVRRGIVGNLSRGYQQRVGLADSLLSEPEVLILDEPTIGLDPNQIRLVRNLIRSFAGRQTVLLSSHILQEVEMVCDRILIIKKGRIVASDTPANLVGLLRGNPRVFVEVKDPRGNAAEVLKAIAGVLNVVPRETDGDWRCFACECRGEPDVRPEIFRSAQQNGWALRELRIERRNLEDVFVEVTTGAAADAPGAVPEEHA